MSAADRPAGTAAPDPPKAERRGRGRIRARGAATPAAPAYITRRIPPYRLLDEAGLVRLEQAADDILAEVGIELRDDPAALRLFRDAGCSVTGERVRFDRGQAAALCRTAPARFTQHARNPARSVEIGGDAVVFSPAYGAPFVYDRERGRRYATLEDFHNLVKLACATPWLHHSGGTVCEPTDLPVNKRHLDMVAAHLRLSDKPFMGSVTAAGRAAESIEMARIVFGPRYVAEHCVLLANINVNSPLVLDATMTDALRLYAAANQAAVVVPFILGGAMGPVTTAGALAQAHAEAMAGVALTQLVRPGAPVIYGNFLSSMSLRSGAPTFGMPEPALAYLAVGQLARRLGVPLRCGGALTASKIADAQAMQESADSLWPALLGGAHFILHAAGWLESGLTVGYEKFVLDADHLGMMHTLLAGLSLDDDHIGLDAHREVGPGKHFLGSAHTMRHYQTAYYDPALSDSSSFEQWSEAGGRDADSRATARWQAVLRDYVPPPLDPAIDEALTAFVMRKKAAAADAWH